MIFTKGAIQFLNKNLNFIPGTKTYNNNKKVEALIFQNCEAHSPLKGIPNI